MHADSESMSDLQYRVLCEQLHAHCGLYFGEDSRFLVEKRVSRRVRDLGLSGFSAYLMRLRRPRAGEDEMTKLIDALTTNETYFFRERNQLRALVEEILPELIERKRDRGQTSPVTIWSAGCSSGEEPCSIAMLAMESGIDPGKDLRIYASDISTEMLAKARKGIYREASFRETEDVLRARYFSECDAGFRVSEQVKRHVEYMHLNLLDRPRVDLLGTMDVILCRNVIIYFDGPTKQEVIQTFYERVRPGGYLLLGHSESLVSLSSAFALSHLKNDLVYRRPVAGEARGDAWHRLAAEIAERESAEDEGGGGALR